MAENIAFKSPFARLVWIVLLRRRCAAPLWNTPAALTVPTVAKCSCSRRSGHIDVQVQSRQHLIQQNGIAATSQGLMPASV